MQRPPPRHRDPDPAATRLTQQRAVAGTSTEEIEADAFGLNAAGEPDGFADASLMLSEYRKMRPGKWEEIVFYDHPSGYNRILMAMTWKAEHPTSGSH